VAPLAFEEAITMVSKVSESSELSLTQAAEYLLEECRMVLPGIQALFGFQLIAVFNSAFSEKLDEFGQYLHLLAIVMVAISVAIIMAPAAYHRQLDPRLVTQRFVDLSTRLLLLSMPPLALAISIDLYLIVNVVANGVLAAVVAALMAAIFLSLWFVLPHLGRRAHTREH
jgi:hypothetical protein